MDRRQREALDRHITGNYGEDSVRDESRGTLADAQDAREFYAREDRPDKITVTTTVDVPLERVAYTLCAALEGGSTYWCERVTVPDYHGQEWAHEALAVGASFELKVFEEDDGVPVLNNRERVKQALNLMAAKYPKHFSDMVQENEDAFTGDTLFQLLCFGEVVYG